MRRILSLPAVIAAFFALVAIGSCGQKKTETNRPPSEQGASLQSSKEVAAEPGKVPPGKVIVDVDVLTCFADEPDYHYGLARTAFLNKDYDKAYDEIVKGAAFVRLESMRASGDEERMLDDAATSLSELADAVKGRTITSVSKLDETFSHAEQALAYHHEMRAEQYWSEDNAKGAGQDLKAASMHLENSMKYGGEKTETDTRDVIKNANDVGDKLVAGTALAADKVGKGMQALGAKIEAWGKKTINQNQNQKK
jgi:hypothetical protein